MSIQETLKKNIIHAVQSAGYDAFGFPETLVTPVKQKSHGDWATNAAMILASKVKSNPRELAQRLVDHMDLDKQIIAKVEIAGPGFINFTLSEKYYHEALEGILSQDTDYGKNNQGAGKKTQVEFVSANPTGPLTIGHGRQAVIGDTIARILEAGGYDVTREYYFNDAGRQMRVLGDSVRLRYLELLGEAVELSEDHYQGDYIKEIAQVAVDEKEATLKQSDDVTYFTELAERMIFEDIKKTVSRIGLVFDVFFNEKSLYETGKIDKVIETLRQMDLVYDEDGAVWFRTSEFGQEQDRVIVKSSGEPTYRLPDIAYHKDKLDRGFDLIIDIFGADHIATYPDVLAGLKALGYEADRVKVLIHQFVTLMEGKEKVKMSTRKANFITLDELMDEVGEDVTRYFFINRSMNSHLNFDLTLAKTQSDENPVFYVQYAHARICSVLRHAESHNINLNDEANLSLLTSNEELELIKILLMYPQIVLSAAEEFEPHRIPTYLEEVATAYHRFQHAGKVDSELRIVTENKELTQARTALCKAARLVLKNGLRLLGISQPEKM